MARRSSHPEASPLQTCQGAHNLPGQMGLLRHLGTSAALCRLHPPRLLNLCGTFPQQGCIVAQGIYDCDVNILRGPSYWHHNIQVCLRLGTIPLLTVPVGTPLLLAVARAKFATKRLPMKSRPAS